MMGQTFDAHIRAQDGAVQSVRDHCVNTAALCARFAAALDAQDCGAMAGMLHDIGKYSPAFQKRIRDPQNADSVDHSTAGAQEAFRAPGQLYPVAFAVAGHHSGLPNGGFHTDAEGSATFFGRMKKRVPDCSAWRTQLAVPPAQLPEHCRQSAYSLSFFTRMLYSCLVDADFLDTEQFMAGAAPPRGAGEPLGALLEKCRAQAQRYLAGPASSPVNAKRCAVLRRCIDAGRRQEPGFFALTVPTGGGKTFASLTFALEHAVRCGLQRVIYVIPYTSIIDQTARVFERLLRPENVLAHYAGAEALCRERDDLSPLELRRALAAENWDAPVVVTTAVQFFDSLYANRSSRCRKLHNLCRSVIIFDEAQTLPVPYLRPCLAAMGELVRRCGASAVLCTATQPELQSFLAEFAPGMPLREICPPEMGLYEALRRTHITQLGTVPQAALAQRLCAAEQVLCVVNRRRTAIELYAALPAQGAFCLTTLLTPSDRLRQLDEIRALLAAGLPCRVVSTSLIEAGVDVDFPIAFREVTGLDSVLQTAGRCNREGRRSPSDSPVYVFALDGVPLPVLMEPNAAAYAAVVQQGLAPDSPQAVAFYFRRLLGGKSPEALDKYHILDAFERGDPEGGLLPFAAIADRFALIDSPTRMVCVPIGEGAALCRRLLAGERTRALLNALGRYGVNIYAAQYAALDRAGAFVQTEDGRAVLTDLSLYDAHTGLALGAESGKGFFV